MIHKAIVSEALLLDISFDSLPKHYSYHNIIINNLNTMNSFSCNSNSLFLLISISLLFYFKDDITCQCSYTNSRLQLSFFLTKWQILRAPITTVT